MMEDIDDNSRKSLKRKAAEEAEGEGEAAQKRGGKTQKKVLSL
jgi:hypothetical protein